MATHLTVRTVFFCNLLLLASSYWIRYESLEAEEEDEDAVLTLEADISDSLFNSRGPRSLYRGMEEETELWWGDYDYEDENNNDVKSWNFYDY